MVDNLLSRIEELKRRKGAVILAHYYTLPEVQAVADFLGDSLALSIEAQKVEARTILFAGVHFMAETAKVLCPDKKVLIPVPEASCSLADGCEAEAFRRFRARYPGHTVVSYVNTSVEIKAQTDVCCTSSNALKVVESIPAEQPILFAPDRNLGAYVQKLTGRTNMVLWDGACHVHEEFSLEKLLALREEHPAAEVVAHPECRAYITAVADFVGSTAAILDYCGRSAAQEFIVVTEAGILAEMQQLRLHEDGDARTHRRLSGKRVARGGDRRAGAARRRAVDSPHDRDRLTARCGGPFAVVFAVCGSDREK